jgi:glucan phosphoethanolaminetransferase (alkaline phosphatase superfamily)
LQQVAVASAFCWPGSVNPPRFIFAASSGTVAILWLEVIAVAVSLAVLAALRLVRWVSRGRTWVMWLIVAGLLLLELWWLASSAFYGTFGVYPSLGLLRDLAAAPAVFLAYTSSGLSLVSMILLSGAVAVIAWSSYRASRRVWRAAPRPVAALLNGIASLSLMAGVGYSGIGTGDYQRYLVDQHSLPAVRSFFGLREPASRDLAEAARRLVPGRVGAEVLAPSDRARHVLLIIAECVRADHLAAYGYSRQTMPFLEGEGSTWVRFERAYAHGARTIDSFPVIFGARYFAGFDKNSAAAQSLWGTLRRQGIGTAFLSAGAMEWGELKRLLGLDQVDHAMTAGDLPKSERLFVGQQRFSYAVDDRLVIDRYVALLSEQLGDRRSLAAIHLVGSHYPYHAQAVPDVFVPSLRTSAAVEEGKPIAVEAYGQRTSMDTAFETRLLNSYDNSLRHIDHLLLQSIAALRNVGLLDDSVVILTSDHGESLGEHGTLFHGTTLYDEQVRVPLLIRVGRNLPHVRAALERRAGGIVGLIDVMPTALHLLAGRPPEGPLIEGASLLGVRGKTHELLAFRGIGEKLAVVTSDRKCIYDLAGQFGEEYDLRHDPMELANLWSGRTGSVDAALQAVVDRCGIDERQ